MSSKDLIPDIAHQILAIGRDYGQDFDDSAAGELADGYREYKESCSGKSKQSKDISKTYKMDRIAQKIVKVPVFDSLANWRDISSEPLKEHDSRLELVEVFKSALELSRLNGAACIFPVLKYTDTQRPVSPRLSIESINRPVEVSAVVVHHKVAMSNEVDIDICSPNYGKPIFYKCGEVEIHHTRAIIVGDIECPFFDSIAGYLCDFHTALKRLSMAVRRNSAFVLKADFAEAQKYIGAIKKVGGTPKSDLEQIADIKASSVAHNLNDNNVAIIGLNESLLNFQAQNIDDLVAAAEQQMYLLSGAGDVLVSRLFSIVKSGLGNSGFQDVQNYAQSLDTLISEMVDPSLRKMDRILSVVYEFDYRPDSWAWNPTKAEQMLLSLRGSEQPQDTLA